MKSLFYILHISLWDNSTLETSKLKYSLSEYNLSIFVNEYRKESSDLF